MTDYICDHFENLDCGITDNEIMSQDLGMSVKRYLLSKKYRINIDTFVEQCKWKGTKLYFKENKIFNFKSKKVISIDFIDVLDGEIHITGRTNLSYFINRFDLYVHDKISNEFFLMEKKEYEAFAQYYNGEKVFTSYNVYTTIPLKENLKLEFIIKEHATEKSVVLRPSFGVYGKLNDNLNYSYFCDKDRIVKLRNNCILVYKKTPIKHIKSEIRFLQDVLLSNNGVFFRVLLYRLFYYIFTHMKRKDVWLISDRPHIAGDNGEAFFRYIAQSQQINAFFLINKKSSDYYALKKVGRIVKYGSLRHKLLFLCSDKLISSSADNWVFRILGEYDDFVKDLLRYKYVFLQHGIIQKDFSKWLHKCKKNISLFVTSTESEYNSIVNGNYGYSANEVKLTGLPRYDVLYSNTKRIIAIMPTWRKYIAADLTTLETNKNIRVRGYSDSFKETDYYKFYQGLLNDSRLIEALQRYDYTVNFYLHPSFERQERDFYSISDRIIINHERIEYKKVFAESSLLITDYSSVAMDFAYLRKPVIYTQFDLDSFLNRHTGKEGYFDYEKYGFGPICVDIDSAVNKIIDYLNNDCKMDKLYYNRVDRFFHYNDQKNCNRVYKKILEL